MKHSEAVQAVRTGLDTLQQQWARISRVVVAVVCPAAVLFLGHGYGPPGSAWQSRAFASFMEWVVVTSVVVTLPTMGKTTQKAVERALGSLCGGALGLMFVSAHAAWPRVLGMAVAVASGEFIAIQFKKEYTGKLISMTYLIVVAPGYEGQPWTAGVLRMGSVLAGIAWTFLVSLVWFPDTSSRVVFKQLLIMMQQVEHLGSDTWALMQHQQLLHPQNSQKEAVLESPPAKDTMQHPPDQAPANSHQQGMNMPQCMLGVMATTATPSGLVNALYPQHSTSSPEGHTTADDLNIDMGGTDGSRTKSSPAQHAVNVQHVGAAKTKQQQLSLLEKHFQGDACDKDVREFFAARVLLQDALAAAAAEHHLGWLCGMPILLPSVLVPCKPSAGCCYRQRRHVSGVNSAASSIHNNTTLMDGNAVQDKSASTSSSAVSSQGDSNAPAAGAATGLSNKGTMHELRPYLPNEEVRMVAIAQRHCSHVLWMLHKLLQDRFDQQGLLFIHKRYPAGMLDSIQHDSQAVLQVATSLLQSAIQHHHRHWQFHRDSSTANPSLVICSQLQQLQASMGSLHTQLQHWQEIFIRFSHSRKQKFYEMLGEGPSKAAPLPGQGLPAATAAPSSAVLMPQLSWKSRSKVSCASTEQIPAADGAPVGAGGAELPCEEQSNQGGEDLDFDLQPTPDLFFITSTSRESYVFVLQWHALHYLLQQLDQAFAELTGSLEQLVFAMHGMDMAMTRPAAADGC